MKTVVGQDDFASMAETIRRRYSRLLRERDESGGDALQQLPGAQEIISGSSVEEDKLSPQLSPLAPQQREETLTPSLNESADAPSSPSSLPGGEKGGVRGDEEDDSRKQIIEEIRTLMHRRREAPKESNAGRPSLPDLILIDGGKGQLNAACAELEKLGLSHIPVIGLAKEFEEIFRPGERAVASESGKRRPQVAAADSRRVASRGQQLQCAASDQADLRERPGRISRHWSGAQGGVAEEVRLGQRLRTATVEQIADVPGLAERRQRS
jgi:excinuclease ABC subunit C